MYSLKFLSCTLAVANAMPLEADSKKTAVTVNFDDITITDPMLQYMPMPKGYQGLEWKDMYAVLLGGGTTPNGQPAAGLQPASGSQAAVFKSTQEGVLPAGPAIATLTTSYDSSSTKAFDLKQFKFGCALTSPQAIVQAPQACTLDVIGFKAGQQAALASASFVFFGNSYVTAPLASAQLPGGFEGLEKVVFQRRTVGVLDQVTQSVVLDDVVVATH